MKIFKVTAAVFLLAYGPAVFAQAMGMGGAMGGAMGAPLPAFAELDADEDGKVTKEEFVAAEVAERRIDRMLSTLDTDEDGALSKEEFDARRPAGGGQQ